MRVLLPLLLAAVVGAAAAARVVDEDAEEFAAMQEKLAELRREREEAKRAEARGTSKKYQRSLAEEQAELRLNRTWGRIYTDRSARSIQYFKGTFGGDDLPLGPHALVEADPPLACGPLENAAEAQGALVLAERGNCTFVDKARAAQEAGAAAVVLLNTDDNMLHPPGGGEGEDIELPVLLVSHSSARLLRHALGSGLQALPLRASAMPIWCHRTHGSSSCDPLTDEEKRLEAESGRGGLLKLPSASFEYALAEFGGPAPTEPFELRLASPLEACEPLDNAEDAEGRLVVVSRGGCSFADKAWALSESGAAGMVLLNSEPCAFRQPAERGWEGSRVPIPVLMVASGAAEALSAGAAAGATAQLEPDLFPATAWSEVSTYLEPTQWPSSQVRRASLERQLRAEHADSAERTQCLEEGVQRLADYIQRAAEEAAARAEGAEEADASGEEFEL